MNELVEIKGTPKIPDNWDYNTSVEKTKTFVYKRKNIENDIYEELYIAREKLSKQGNSTGANQYGTGTNVPVPTWDSYCKEIGTERRTVNRWLKEIGELLEMKEKYPVKHKEITVGIKTLKQAKREIVKENVKDQPELPTDKYRVVYADPPWNYGNSGLDDYGHAERHYPTMSIEELGQLGVPDIVEENSVLFIWTTSPLLEDCFRVIRMWDFKYKTSFVWNKIKHNFGYYNSVRHELLLVCTKGSCLPDNSKLFNSVQSIERKAHSEKPDEFREIIDTLYTKGKKIELFSRKKVKGWDVWGNQV